MAECRRVAVCADASPDLGLGHVMRSLALAHELAAIGCAVTICGTGIPPELGGSMNVVAPSRSSDPSTVIGLRPDLAVVDGYHFDADFFTALEGHGIAYVVIDDNGDTPARRPTAVVNQNPHASPTMYDRLDGDPLLLLGVRFAMLRREIVEVARRAPVRRQGTIFVAFGGSDPLRLTRPVALRLASEGLAVRVAVGPAHPERASLVAQLDAEPEVTVTDPADYAAELATASAAVLAAGSSLLEAACLGTPVLAVIVADNQQRLATAALNQGLTAGLLLADDDLLPNMVSELAVLESPPGPDRVPGDGARRVAESLIDLIAGSVRLRPASMDDAGFVFALRTDAEVRRNSFLAPPTWEEHLEWFRTTVTDPGRRLLIVESDTALVGQVRLDTVGDHAVVSLAIAEPSRGHGLARRVLGAVTAAATGDLVAHIKPDNERSRAAFTSAGFEVESANAQEIVMRWTDDGSMSRGAPS
jgi:UDP-2,4-diacetamido-2,4,6-trideoxy-beta-L-altropyranose hydrolase